MSPTSEELRVIYEDFKAHVREASERGPAVGLVPLPDLRRTVGASASREEFDALVMRLHAEGLIHLMSHVEPESLPPQVLRDCLVDESGLLLYWLRWL